MAGQHDSENCAVSVKDIEEMEHELQQRREKLLADLHATGGAMQALAQLKEQAHE